MGTPQVPESNPSKPPVADIPRMGLLMWGLLAMLLIPPVLISLCGSAFYMQNQILWMLLLGIPIPLVLFSLPKKYLIQEGKLIVVGYYYRVIVPIVDIKEVVPVSTLQALLHPGSLFSTDPSRSLKVIRNRGRSLVISPRNSEPFLHLAERTGGSS